VKTDVITYITYPASLIVVKPAHA